MIRSRIFVFYIAVFCSFGALQDDPDALYRERETLASAKRAEQIWTTRLAADPRDFASAWKLARADYWLGTNGLPPAERNLATGELTGVQPMLNPLILSCDIAQGVNEASTPELCRRD